MSKKYSAPPSLPLHSDVVRLYHEVVGSLGQLDHSLGGYGDAICEALDFRRTYLLTELESKYSEVESCSADERRSKAINKWLMTEQRNAKTNIRLYSSESCFGRSRIQSEELLDFASRVIKKVLGDDPPKGLVGGFTNGSSTSQRRGAGSKARKLTEQAHVTAEAWPYALPMLLEGAAGWVIPSFREGNNPRYVEANMMFTEP